LSSWKKVRGKDGILRCSQCAYPIPEEDKDEYPVCPECGAEMEVGNET